MIGMLIVGYVFAIPSERVLCLKVQVNLAYRWFRGLGPEDEIDGRPSRSMNEVRRFDAERARRDADKHVARNAAVFGYRLPGTVFNSFDDLIVAMGPWGEPLSA